MLTLEIEQESEWVKFIEQGEEIIVMQHNKPIAKIIPFSQQTNRKLGTATGLFTLSDDFNEPLNDFDGYQ